jgi:hypothetical protein
MAAVDNFKNELREFGFAQDADRFLQAIYEAYLSGGNREYLPEPDTKILEQLGIGRFPSLNEKGIQIGRELANIEFQKNKLNIESILKSYPSKVVALFFKCAIVNTDIYSL